MLSLYSGQYVKWIEQLVNWHEYGINFINLLFGQSDSGGRNRKK